MNKIKKTLAIIFCVYGLQVHASTLSGKYLVAASSSCDLQVNSTEVVVADQSKLTINLVTNYAQNGSTMVFSALNSDNINRPDPRFAALGAQTVRVISGYSNDGSEFYSSEYRYDSHLSDGTGTAKGLYMTLQLKADNYGVQYTKTYSNGEVYQCNLIDTL